MNPVMYVTVSIVDITLLDMRHSSESWSSPCAINPPHRFPLARTVGLAMHRIQHKNEMAEKMNGINSSIF